MRADPVTDLRAQHLDRLADYVRTLYRQPRLRHLFLELTLRCNERCFHCGSSCTAAPAQGELTLPEWRRVLEEVRADFADELPMLCVTGGEPLLYEDFFPLMEYARDLGFRWGMTSNATLITPQVAERLARAGMGTVSVSIDGLPATHDRLRGTPGGYERALAGIQNLLDVGAFRAVQVTTVVNHESIGELDELFGIMDGLDIDSWRVIGLEPIGRARRFPQRLLTPDDQRRLFSFVRDKRAQGYPLTSGCSHYLGLAWETEVRDWYWMCNAGICTASVMSNGDIGACLDIERRPETIQGNVRAQRFSQVWREGFGLFRRDLSDGCAGCEACDQARWCRGGAHHSWDYDAGRPLICLKGILF